MMSGYAPRAMGMASMMNTRPATAGLAKLQPMPPKSILTTATANTVPRIAGKYPQSAGSVKANSMAVTTQDRSPAVLSRCMSLQHTCSVTSAVATQTSTSSGAPRP